MHHFRKNKQLLVALVSSFLRRPLHWHALEVVIPVLRPQTTTKITLFQEQCCRLIAHLPPHDEEDLLSFEKKKNDETPTDVHSRDMIHQIQDPPRT